jgi:hypothetical protein
LAVQVGNGVADYATQTWDKVVAPNNARVSLMSEPVQIDKPVTNYRYAIEAASAIAFIGAGVYLTYRPKKVALDDDFTQV